jgi:hypothetical protein
VSSNQAQHAHAAQRVPQAWLASVVQRLPADCWVGVEEPFDRIHRAFRLVEL